MADEDVPEVDRASEYFNTIVVAAMHLDMAHECRTAAATERQPVLAAPHASPKQIEEFGFGNEGSSTHAFRRRSRRPRGDASASGTPGTA